MTFANWILVGVAVFAILGAVGAFTIAFRRTKAEKADPTAGVSDETRQADRSMAGVRLEPIVIKGTEQPVADEAPGGGDESGAAEEVVATEEAEDLEPVGVGTGIEVVETQRVVEVSPAESGVSRRQFFNRALGVGWFFFLGFQGIAYLAFMWPKLSGGFGSDVVAGTIEELTVGTVTGAGTVQPKFIPAAKAYVVPAPDTLSEQFEGKQVAAGGFMALYQRCVHLGCRVPWCASSIGFECPCHGSKYNRIGEYFTGPAPRNLDRFTVEIDEENFIIHTGTIIKTPRAQKRSVPFPQGPFCV